ncbi:signal peptidase I [Bacteroides muris (ex Fokt et al. 2023)]|uniref:Signal peptidase I n=1 Tax=Bacteroides muris (ex Fokt et al. 2023) TaxID=2937417 RepID=A0A9X2NS65_9BACE|nr:signal peptidase I [Bacteroides muris (ex Fokt et al. 2023)]MCR6504417.1 signal peptidase I [Bacteroides muris (ex Fokt et al. 2023)]
MSSSGTYVIMGDSDDSYDFSALSLFTEKLSEGYDLVMGNRFSGGIKPDAMPFLHRYLGNPVLSFMGRVLFHIPIQDFHCGLRGFRRSAYEQWGVTATGMEFASEMVVKAALCRHSLCEVPTILYPDGRERHPHLRSWRDGYRHFRLLSGLYFEQKNMSARHFSRYFVVALLLVLLIKMLVGEPVKVASCSMLPTLKPQEWIWCDKASYGALMPRRFIETPLLNLLCFIPGVMQKDTVRDWGYRRMVGFREPERLDIVIFKRGKGNNLYIKRIIGMPGDTLRMQEGKVYVNGQALKDTGSKYSSYDGFSDIVVAPKHYFVMGDFRSNSYDSRRFGCICWEDIVGRMASD